MKKIYYCLYYDKHNFCQNRGRFTYGNKDLALKELSRKGFINYSDYLEQNTSTLKDKEDSNKYQYILLNDFDIMGNIFANIVEEDVYDTETELKKVV